MIYHSQSTRSYHFSQSVICTVPKATEIVDQSRIYYFPPLVIHTALETTEKALVSIALLLPPLILNMVLEATEHISSHYFSLASNLSSYRIRYMDQHTPPSQTGCPCPFSQNEATLSSPSPRECIDYQQAVHQPILRCSDGPHHYSWAEPIHPSPWDQWWNSLYPGLLSYILLVQAGLSLEALYVLLFQASMHQFSWPYNLFKQQLYQHVFTWLQTL